MSKRQVLIILGIWVMVFLFLGFPPEWDKVLAIIAGLLIVISAFRFKSTQKPVSSGQVPYVEHRADKPSDVTRSITSPDSSTS